MRDIAQLRDIARLGSEGVSLEGIRRVLDLENENRALRDRVRELETVLAGQLVNRPGARVFAATTTGADSPGQGCRVRVGGCRPGRR